MYGYRGKARGGMSAGRRTINKPEPIVPITTQHYYDFCRTIFPKNFASFTDRAMRQYEKNQPKGIDDKDETDEDYQDRCDVVYQNLRRKHDTCDKDVEVCQQELKRDERHDTCELNRQKDYKHCFPRGEPADVPKRSEPIDIPRPKAADFPNLEQKPLPILAPQRKIQKAELSTPQNTPELGEQ